MLSGEEEGGKERVGALVAGNTKRIQAEYAETYGEEKAAVDGFLSLFLSGKG